MFCTNCGKEVNDNAVICVHCGVPLAGSFSALPVREAQPKTVNGLGIAGFVLGLLSFWFGVFFCVTAIAGLIFSIIGTVNVKKYNSSNGLAIAGLVLSIITTVLWLFFWIMMIVTGAFYA